MTVNREHLLLPVNREHLLLFTAALRSGEFEQGRGRLRVGKGDDATYCCLGVATIIAHRNGCPISDEELEDILLKDSNLPDAVMEFYGLDSPNPGLKRLVPDPTCDRPMTSAIGANDDHGWTFDVIADAFERTYLSDEAGE